MQSLIPFFFILGLCSGSHLTILPYVYLAEPLPVYHQSQNTRTGEHAYSYAGGPSAKEEVRGLDGVTRGSYSYVDANGILQSVFYVADEGGFRVAATNLPGDENLSVEPAEVLLARSTETEIPSKIEEKLNNRRKRSLQDTDQNSNQNPQENKDSKENLSDQNAAESIQTFIYKSPESILLPKLLATATSHQSQVQIHKNFRIESPEVEDTVKVKEPVNIVQAPLSSILPFAPITAYSIQSLPVVAAFPSYQENRIHLHKSFGIEGSAVKDTVKIKTEPVTLVEAPVPVVSSVLAKEAVPVLKEVVPQVIEPATASVTTTISSHGISQIHGDSKATVTAPILSEPTLLLKSPVVSEFQPVISLPLYQTLPYARAAHYRTQIHAN